MEGREPARPETDAATAENLNHLARLLSNGAPVNLKLNGRRVALPDDASLTIDLERDPETGCAEVDIRWSAGSLGSRRSGGRSLDAEHGETTRTERTDTKVQGPHIRLNTIVAVPGN
jgi:hypothetical protein